MSVIAFLLFTVLFLAWFVVPVCGCQTKESAKATVCLSNVKQQAQGLIEYAGDHDDRLPSRDAWLDGIAPYVKDERTFHDPELGTGAYGYAFNAALSRAATPRRPETVPMVYDSANPIRNASDLVTSLPHPGRHHGRNSVAYADGHARRVAAETR